jgi:hypothetical protein
MQMQVVFLAGVEGNIRSASYLLVDRKPCLQYPTTHHSPTKQSTGLFCFTVRALSGLESLLFYYPQRQIPP